METDPAWVAPELATPCPGSAIFWSALRETVRSRVKTVDSAPRFGRFCQSMVLNVPYLPRTPTEPGPSAGWELRG
jgi:hypothetical protein